jgi:hypothetical protein
VTTAAQVAALVTLGTNALAALVGALGWWRSGASRAAWIVVRAGQAAAVGLALAAGVLAVSGFTPDDGLFWLYAVLPVAVSFVAEQLRVLSAQTVLDARELPDAAAVGALPEEEQQGIVDAIVRREIGVMAISAAVLAFLALRALAEL